MENEYSQEYTQENGNHFTFTLGWELGINDCDRKQYRGLGNTPKAALVLLLLWKLSFSQVFQLFFGTVKKMNTKNLNTNWNYEILNIFCTFFLGLLAKKKQ